MNVLSVRVRSAGRRWRLLPSLGFWLAVVMALVTGNTALAQSPTVTRVEEDWEVEMGAPDPDTNAPQICTVVSPVNHLYYKYAVFELNHATQPEYDAGGMQLQSWVSEWNYDFRNFPNVAVSQTADEVITFTLAMSVGDGKLKFEVLNGTSTTWGSFGGQGYLKLEIPAGITDLDTYDPETSIQHSRVGFASHRVKRFVRKQVRYYSGDDLVSTDTTERVVHEHQAESN